MLRQGSSWRWSRPDWITAIPCWLACLPLPPSWGYRMPPIVQFSSWNQLITWLQVDHLTASFYKFIDDLLNAEFRTNFAHWCTASATASDQFNWLRPSRWPQLANANWSALFEQQLVHMHFLDCGLGLANYSRPVTWNSLPENICCKYNLLLKSF